MPLEDAATSLAGWADAAAGAIGAVATVGAAGTVEAVGAEDEKNEEHPARTGQTAIESSMRDRLRPLPRLVLRAFGRMGASFPMGSLYPAQEARLNYE